MPLFKFCKPEHNVHRGAKVQIGTLFKYREIEHLDLQDENEGKYTFHISFPRKIELDQRWASLLLQGSVQFGRPSDVPRFPGHMELFAEALNIVEVRDKTVVVEDTRIRIDREVPNCFVFCMSDFPTADKNPFPQYLDNWNISENLAADFAARLGTLIFEQAKLQLFDDAISKFHSPGTVKSLALNVRHQHVMYRDRQLSITPEARPSFDELVKVLTDVAFVKPTKYSKESEYRFVFELTDGRRLFPPKVDHLLLNPNVLTNLA